MKTWSSVYNTFLSALVVAALALPGAAMAQVYEYGGYVIGQNDRVVLREFIVNQHARSCQENETRRIEPCGLASRILVSYVAGSTLPLDVSDEVVPARVTRQIAPAPQGASYVYAGDSVYLIDVLSRRIIDTVPMATD